MRDSRAQSPPREAVLTMHKILKRPPQAPVRRRRPVWNPRHVFPLPASLLAPWAGVPEDDQDEVLGTPPSFSIQPRRLFVDQVPDDSDVVYSSDSGDDSQSTSEGSQNLEEDLNFISFSANRRNRLSPRNGRSG